MIPNINLTGNLTKDPELRFNDKGTAIASGSVACSKPKYENGNIVRNQQGFTESAAELFLPFTAFNAEAEALASAGKGSTVNLVGELVTESWGDKRTGERKSITKLKVQFCRVVKSKSQQGSQQQGWGQAPQSGNPQGWGAENDPWASPQSQNPPF